MTVKSGNKHVVDLLFTLSLFCVFAASAFIVVYIGADVYRATVDRMEMGFEINTTLNFVSTKIRQHDEAGSVRIAELEGRPAVVLDRRIGDSVFETWIYHYDGALRELFINRENTAGLRLDAGQELIRIYSFEITAPHERIIAIRAGSSDAVYKQKLVGIRSM